MKKEFWYLILIMFLVSFLVGILPFEVIMLFEIILWLAAGYMYWENEKEKEERIRRLEKKLSEVEK